MTIDTSTPLSRMIPEDLLPFDVITPPPDLIALLDRILVTRYEEQLSAGNVHVDVGLSIAEEVVFELPGLAGISLVLGGASAATLLIGADFSASAWSISLSAGARLRFSREWLRPVVRREHKWEEDLTREYAEISVGAGIRVRNDWSVEIVGTNEFKLDPVMISDSGFVIEGTVALDLSETSSLDETLAIGLGTSWRGVVIKSLRLYLPDDLDVPLLPSELQLEKFHIGSGGVSGRIRGNWTPSVSGTTISGPGSGTLFGMSFGLRSIAVDLQQSAITGSEIKGVFALPYFEKPLDVSIGFDLGGSVAVTVDSATGLAEFTLAPGGTNLMHVLVKELSVAVESGLLTVAVSGRITPLFGAPSLEWPSFDIKRLSIDSEGNVRFEGGWIELPSQYALNFYGFQIEITKLGFGKTDDGGKWIGFSGGLKLVDGMSAGASVEGLRLTWYPDTRPIRISLDGAGVEFEVPDVLKFKGSVSYRELTVDTEKVRRFDGDIKLTLNSLSLEIDAVLVIGSATTSLGATYTFFAIYLGVELPAGIPLWATGLALYGMAGLFALSMEPNKLPTEEWYEGWYKRSTPGVTDLRNKWVNRQGSLALGAGVTIGTVADNGFTFAGKVLLCIVFPGPILLIEGKASLLQERAKLSDEANFRALAVLDNRAGMFLIGLDAFYRYESAGELVDIRGGSEAFYDFNDASKWHLYLGERDPREKRIRASFFKGLFDANAYFMLDANRLATGAWVGYDKDWAFGPLRVTLEAWIEGNVIVSWKPAHFYGDLWLHGRVALSAFGFGLSLSLDARVAADVFDPFHILATLDVAIDLPWPLPDLSASVKLEWGPEPLVPPLPAPLKEIAIEHFKVTTSWPLPRGQLLLPNYDPDGDGFLPDPLPAYPGQEAAAPPSALPIVPLDARPHLTFGRAVNDDARVGVNVQPLVPEWERIGDPSAGQGPVRARYALNEITLSKWTGTAWQTVARKGSTANAAGERTLYGSWAAVPQMPDGGGVNAGQVKLWLWSKSAFDYTRHGGRTWDEWFTDRFANYPCVPQPPLTEICCDLRSLPAGQRLFSPWVCTGSGIKLIWLEPKELHVSSIPVPQPVGIVATTLPAAAAALGATAAPSAVPVSTETCDDFSDIPKDISLGPTFTRAQVMYQSIDGSALRSADVVAPIGRSEIAFRPAGLRAILPVSADAVTVDVAQFNNAPFLVRAFNAAGALVAQKQESPPIALVVSVQLQGTAIARVEITSFGPSVSTSVTGAAVGRSGPSSGGAVAADASSASASGGGGTVASGGGTAEGSAATVVTEGPVPEITVTPTSVTATTTTPTTTTPATTGGGGPTVHDLVLAKLCYTVTTTPTTPTAPPATSGGTVVGPAPVGTGTGATTQTLCFGAGSLAATQLGANVVGIALPNPVDQVVITLSDAGDCEAYGANAQGMIFGPFYGGGPGKPQLKVSGQSLTLVRVRPYSQMCLFEICARVGGLSDPQRQEMATHQQNELARWSQEAEVLEPHTTYRLRVKTQLRTQGAGDYASIAAFNKNWDLVEYAYFRTQGPPSLTSLSVPIGHPASDFDSGLDDLVRYVKQTVPPTVPASGQRPHLPRPVYRAYDTGVEFNESYVDLMYRQSHRDLGLYLFDANNRPVRDARGRLVVLGNLWGRTDQLTLSESEQRWVDTINAGSCGVITTAGIPRNRTLSARLDGLVLDPDALSEARLVPLLLREDYLGYAIGATATGPSGTLGRWTVRDDGTNNAPGRWQVAQSGNPPSRHLTESSGISGGTTAGNDPRKPGTLLLRADDGNLPAQDPLQPSRWSDYRMTTYVRSSSDGALGVVFRYQDQNNHYHFAMDRARKYRRLVRVLSGFRTILAEDDFVYRKNQDYRITIEAVGEALRVQVDGDPVFSVNDPAMDRGTIGLYTWSNPGARFGHTSVDDYRPTAPVAYRYRFTTSKYTSFMHHLHSYQDEVWRSSLAAGGAPTDAQISALATAAALSSAAPTDAEHRAYDGFATHILGSASESAVSEVEVSRVERAGQWLAFLVRSPEPIDWRRTALDVRRAARRLARPSAPKDTKVVGVTFASTMANQESATVLLRETLSPRGHRIEYRQAPGPIAEQRAAPLFTDNFEVAPAGGLFHEDFGPNALDRYTIIDEGTIFGPSNWALSGGVIAQNSYIFGGNTAGSVPDKPGTMAVTGSAQWSNIRFKTTLRSLYIGTLGVLFRYRDRDNYYRFSMDQYRSYRRLIKKTRGVVTTLWEDAVPYQMGHPYRLTIDAYGARLIGYLDDVLLFSLLDRDLDAGKVGLYAWQNGGARFVALDVESLDRQSLLWQPTFAALTELTIKDAPGAIQGPSNWSVQGGKLVQTSNIQVVAAGSYEPATHAVGGDERWRDVEISVRLRSTDDDAIGVLFRYVDEQNYYRFSMDSQRAYRRLIRKVNGVVTLLWQDAVAYTVGKTYDLTIRAIGADLRGFLDGAQLFALSDGALPRGRIGFYCWAEQGAIFERVVVADRTRYVGPWRIVDEGPSGGRSEWRVSGGALLQTSLIDGGSLPAAPGTFAVVGDLRWTDYRLTARIRSDSDDAIGVLFRYVDPDNYYRVSLDSQRNYRRLVRKLNGAITTLWQQTAGFVVGEPLTLTIDAVGARLTGYLGTAQMFEVQDGNLSAGGIGMYTWANDGARFEEVEVRRPPLLARALLRDRFASSGIAGWTVVDDGTLLAPSSWSAQGSELRQTSDIHSSPTDWASIEKRGTFALSGDPSWTDVIISVRLRSLDDDAIGLMFRVLNQTTYYRFSMDRQRSYRRLVKRVGNTWTKLWEDRTDYQMGRAYELTVAAVGSTLRGYLDGIPLFAVSDPSIAAGRLGLYCWGNTDARFSDVRVYPVGVLADDWLLAESFDFTFPERWSFVDASGTAMGPGQWAIVSGELRQTSGIALAAGELGTHAIAGELEWSDYQCAVRLESRTSGAIGVLFRYRDEQNYYRFSMSRSGSYRRLVKRVAGTMTTLWQDTQQYQTDRQYLFTVRCQDDRLVGFLDGAPVFDVQDGAIGSGKIGLYASGNSDGRFQEVRVTAVAWATYYEFGREPRLPAGTRLRVYSGSAIGAPAPDPGVAQRFVATLDNPGVARFDGRGVHLRVVASTGHIEHARPFLPDTDYTAVSPRVLRKRDGTAFFVTVPSIGAAGTALAAGDYRLRFTYRRDNRAADPGSQILSEAGRSDAEIVTLDLPGDVR